MMSARFPGIMLALAASVALLGCGNEAPPPAPPAPVAPPPKPNVTVNLGHVAPMSGSLVHLGQDNQNAAQLAVDDLNARALEIGGAHVSFRLQTEDDRAEPAEAEAVASKLVALKVHGVIGHLTSGTTVPASRIYHEAGLPQISGASSHPLYTRQAYGTAFRTFVNDTQQAAALVQFAQKKGFQKIVLVDDGNLAGQGQAEEFRKAAAASGLKIMASYSLPAGASDYRAVLNPLKARKPDLLVFTGMDVQAGPFLQEMQALKIKATFLTPDGACTPETLRLAGEAAEGQFCSLPGRPLELTPQGTEFKARYAAKYGQEIQLYAPNVYDAVMVVADAMQRADSVEPAKYLAELPRTSLPGVTGVIEFDEFGDLKNGAVSIYQAQGGQWRYQETLGAPLVEAAPAADPAPAAAVPAPAAAPAGSQ